MNNTLLERQRKNDRARMERRKSLLNDIKLTAGCTDCGYAEHPEALDFDHVYGMKAGGVSSMMSRGHVPWPRILDEIAKCEVVCANCHRIRTFKRRKGN